ncbi:glutathione S-transferase [Frateuria edaphi]|uniref:glutathione S-transferase n=1 Tax=Frateuria edaphi TaxID=2898793 RepID=UPI001E3F21AF|nr:glutathione S-transferase [Frateuria edaphi]UGB45215.1 glutathione S-transferase [Frateuria edaphi]
MTYELYYWTGIQGRGEFVRLALEDAGADYIDVARHRGDAVMDPFLSGGSTEDALPFAPPFLRAGHLLIAQTAAILGYLGQHLRLVPEGEARRIYANQLQLTITDLVAEIHDSHHPIAASLYYEDQRREAQRRAADLRKHRLPKYLGYFEQVLARSDGRHALGEHSYVDLSLFQLIAGLDYAFPNAMRGLRKDLPRLCALAQEIAQRPRIAAYLASPRRPPFNEQGIFRHYPELDDQA